MEVLPAPLGPRMATTSPCVGAEGHAVDRGGRPVADHEVLALDGRHAKARYRCSGKAPGAAPVAWPLMIDVRLIREDRDAVAAALGRRGVSAGPGRPGRRAGRGRPGAAPGPGDDAGPGEGAVPAGRRGPPGQGRRPGGGADRGEPHAGRAGAGGGRGGRARPGRRSARRCSCSRTCRPTTPPTAAGPMTTSSCGGGGPACDDGTPVPRVRRAPAGAALGHRRASSASSTWSAARCSPGSMFPMFRKMGGPPAAGPHARCALARHADAYEEIRPPTLVLTETMTATGHLPRFSRRGLPHRARRPVGDPDRRGAAHLAAPRRDPGRGRRCRCGSPR